VDKVKSSVGIGTEELGEMFYFCTDWQ